MTECLIEILPIILYLLIFVLIGFLIVLVYRAIKTLAKVEAVVDDVNDKSKKLNGLFDIIDNTADGLSQVSDMVVNGVASLITGLFKKNKKKKENEDE
jgi:uncharacterized protein YoxC